MLYTDDSGDPGGTRETAIIDATARQERAAGEPARPPTGWPAIEAWADALARRIAADQANEHVAVFVPDVPAGGLRLAAQVWGAGEDTGEVVVGEWIVPLEGSVTGRVQRTGSAALCQDVSLDPDYRGFPGGRTRSSLTVPVGSPGAVVAVIDVEAPWTSAFSVRDYERLTGQAAEALLEFPASVTG